MPINQLSVHLSPAGFAPECRRVGGGTGRKMPGTGAYVFTEPGDYEASVDEARVELVVTGSGPFKAALTRVELGELDLLRSQEDLASVAYAALRADRVFVAFPTWFNPPPVWGGLELQPGDIVFHALGEHVHQRAAGTSGKGFIALALERLAFWSHALIETDVVPPTIARIVRPFGSAVTRLFRLHADACRLVEESPTVIAHPEVTRALEQELIQALIACLGPDAPLQARPLQTRRAAVMNRFQDELASSRPAPAHAGALRGDRRIGANAAAQLRRVSGDEPRRYLRLRQLRLARAALRRADAPTSVAAVARQYGFGELGRFASLYRAVYGETPLATLRPRRP